MIKKTTLIFILIIFIILFYTQNTYAAKSNNINYKIVSIDAGWGYGSGDTEKRALESLSGFGYEGEMKDEIRWETTISFCTNSIAYYDINKNGKYWKIQIGNSYIEEEINFDTAKQRYACEEKKPTDNEIKKALNGNGKKYVKVFSYDAVIIAKKDLSNMATSQDATGNGNAGIAIYIDSIYTGKEMEEGRNVQLSDKNTKIAAVEGTEEAGNAFTEIIGKLFMIIIELHRGFYGDGPQILLNTIQTSTFAKGISRLIPWNISYEGEEILKDANKNGYVNFKQDGTTDEKIGQKIKKVYANENGFDEKTPIPIIPVDFYTMAVGKISAFDINFLTGQNNAELHSEGSAWIIIRNLAASIIHITIYIGAAFLLITLIIHGINIIKGIYIKTEETPIEKKKKHDGIKKFATSLLLLIGSIIIMSLCIFVSDMVFEDIKTTETSEFPIRIVLKDSDNIYSFSTNATGYVRYMSEISNVSLIGDKLMYSIVYIFLVWINCIGVICMFVRFVALIILSIMGPIIAVGYAIDKKDVFNMTYQQWTLLYIGWSSIQLILAIAYRIILEVAFK